jgi:hypothetical protein
VHRSTRWLLFAGLALALAVRLLYFFMHPGDRYYLNRTYEADSTDYTGLALSLLNSEGYSIEGRPTASIMPGYAGLVAAVFAIAGPNVVAVRVVQVVMAVLLCLLISQIACAVFGREAGLWALLMGALYLPLVQMPCYIMTECLYTTLLFLGVLLGVHLLRKVESITLALATGAVLGLCLLTRPIGLAVASLLALVLLLRHHHRALPALACVTLAFALCWAPWIARNYVSMGTWIPLSSGGGISIYRANNPKSNGGFGGWILQGIDTGGLPPPDGRSEVQQDRFLHHEAATFIRENPGRYAWLCWRRAVNLFRPSYEGSRRINTIVMWMQDVCILYPLSAIGMIVAWRVLRFRRRKKSDADSADCGMGHSHGGAGAAVPVPVMQSVEEIDGVGISLLVALFLVCTGMLILTITEIRYRWPLMPIVIVFAAYGCTAIRHHLSAYKDSFSRMADLATCPSARPGKR